MSRRITILDEQIVRPRRSGGSGELGGVDYGAPRKVLAVKGKLELWWRAGHTDWVSLGQSGYYEATLMAADLSKGRAPMPKYIAEGGRLGRPMFERHAKEIDAFFGTSVAEHLHPRKTVKIG